MKKYYYALLLYLFFFINYEHHPSVHLKKGRFYKQVEMAAVITALYGTREKTLKRTIEQTYPTDFYAFVDNETVQNNGSWRIFSQRFQDMMEYKSPIDNGKMVNSLNKNKHPYMQYRYYKMQFFLLPFMKKYKYVLWIDSQLSLKTTTVVEKLIKKIEGKDSPILLYENPYRKTIKDECATAKKVARWNSTIAWGIPQPFQNISYQTDFYYSRGYSENYFRKHCNYSNYGLWNSGFFFMDMSHPLAVPLLNEWYFQNLNFSTMCQISFPYSCWKVGVFPISLHPGSVYKNNLTIYFGHAK